jgi:creatinine amidohydrolase
MEHSVPFRERREMPPQPYILSATPWKAVRTARFDLAILPWGATEAHNYHLPFGTDNIESDFIAAESARRAWEAGARPVVLPTIPFGVNTGQLDIPLTINMNPSTQAAVLGDVVTSLVGHGIRKLVILNSHGGNDFKQMIRELQGTMPEMLICTINWWQILPQKDFFEQQDDHAGEMETSIMLAIKPELVLPLSEAGSGRGKPFALKGLREKWAWTPRVWTKTTDDTGVGDPAAATADKGRRFLEAVTGAISAFIVELANADPNNLQ